MPGQTNLSKLLKTMSPKINECDYVFCTIPSFQYINQAVIIGSFREEEGLTVILNKTTADSLSLNYTFVAAWITLTVHSSLKAVGLTAAFSNALAKEDISCNVIAAYYHDHIFVAKIEAERALKVLHQLAEI